MRLLLDTQILIWLVTDRERLSEGEKATVLIADELLVSALSLMELRIKWRAEKRKGRPPSVPSPVEVISFCGDRKLLIYDFGADNTTVELNDDPKPGDPFDEMLLAHAQALQAKLFTRDRKLRHHPLAYHP